MTLICTECGHEYAQTPSLCWYCGSFDFLYDLNGRIVPINLSEEFWEEAFSVLYDPAHNAFLSLINDSLAIR